MKQLQLILLFLLTTGTAWGQGQADSLYRQMERGEITGEEWYLGILKLGKVSDDVNGWVKYDEPKPAPAEEGSDAKGDPNAIVIGQDVAADFDASIKQPAKPKPTAPVKPVAKKPATR